jgi:glycogen debranching enzyme
MKMMNRLRRKISSLVDFLLRRKAVLTNIDIAYEIAKSTLRDRYAGNGIHAGKSHFSDNWLRDSSFAGLGSLCLGDYEIVRTNILIALKHIKEDGQLPLRIGQKNMLLKMLGIKGKIGATYKEDKGVSRPKDQNSLIIILAAKYVEVTKDKQLIMDNFEQLHRAMEWNFSCDEDHDLLIEEGYYAGWADSIKKHGKVLYTNILHYKAVEAFVKLCEIVNNKTAKAHYAAVAKQIKERINALFWNGHYYIDWLGKHRNDFLATDGNLLAILFDMADDQQAKQIEKHITKYRLDKGEITELNYPKYAAKHIFPLFFPIFIQDYHNGLQWLWIGCADVIAKAKVGREKDGMLLLEAIAKKIVQYNGIYEVYFEGKPLKRFFYSSEQGFAWSAGFFILACHYLGVK